MNPHIITCQYITNQFNLLIFAHIFEHLFYFRIDISHQRLICFHSPFSLLAHFFSPSLSVFYFFPSAHPVFTPTHLSLSYSCPPSTWASSPSSTSAPPSPLPPFYYNPPAFPQSFHPHHLLPFIPSSSSSLLFTCLPFVSAISSLLPFLHPTNPPPILLLVEDSGVETIRRSTGIRIPALFDHQSLL